MPTYSGRRDARFVTVRRGGALEDAQHRQLALWATDCAERVLPLFERERLGDDRPRAPSNRRVPGRAAKSR